MCQDALRGSRLTNIDDDEIAVEKAMSKADYIEKLNLAVRGRNC